MWWFVAVCGRILGTYVYIRVMIMFIIVIAARFQDYSCFSGVYGVGL